MPAVLNYLRGQVLSRSTKRLSLLVLIQVLSQPEISQLYISVLLHQHILGFQISMHNLIGVQIPQSNQYLRGDEFGLLFREPLFVANMVVEVATPHVV